MRLRMIAEGIETAAQLEQLHCEVGQGYHFSRPLCENELARYLRTGALTTVPSSETAAPPRR